MEPLAITFDAIVIGAGVNGSSAALHLAKYGENTVLIEQFPLPHSRGSSAGQSRIIRYGNTSPEAFLPIIIDAYKQWKDLEKETQTALLRSCPLYTISNAVNDKAVQLMFSSAEKASQNPKWRTGLDFNKEYGTAFDSEYVVVEELNAGVLMASKCILALQNKFAELGGSILDEFPITKISIDKSGRISVKSPKGIIEGDYLIICAGPWSSGLLQQLGIDHLKLKPLRIGVYYWQLKEQMAVKPFNFIMKGEGVPECFGLPAVEYPDMLKILMDNGTECDPDTRDCVVQSNEEKLKEILYNFVHTNFPFLEKQPAIIEACIYTESPDGQMIIDQHPKYKNIAYGCGFSGAGFKTGPTVGQILSELVLGKSCSFDIAAFRSDRFKNTQ